MMFKGGGWKLRTFGIVMLAAAIIFAIGWIFGSATTCSKSGGCTFSPESAGALGTWVGSFATAGALLVAASDLKGDRHLQMEGIDAQAQRVTIRVEPVGKHGPIESLNFSISNNSESPIRRVELLLKGEERKGKGTGDLVDSRRRHVIKNIPLNALGLPDKVPVGTRDSFQKWIREKLSEGDVVAKFDLDGHRYCRDITQNRSEACE